MVERRRTKQMLLSGLIRLSEEGHELRANTISRKDSGLYNALYYKDGNGKRFYNSLTEAREDVARYFESQGMKDKATNVRALNLPQVPATKLTDEKKYTKKVQLTKRHAYHVFLLCYQSSSADS